jgi:Ca2+-binding RTX toxin-like protein
MGHGTGRALALAAIAATSLAAATSAGAEGGSPGASTSLSAGHVGTGAQAAQTSVILDITGAAIDNRINVFTGPTGRLTIASPEGIAAPASPAMECTQDSTTQVSCIPGFISVIVGNLDGGNDTFTTAASLPILIGAVVNGARRPMSGGIGRDRIVGGAAGDGLRGDAGPDTLIGGGGTDGLEGGSAKDNLNGGAAGDALFGGAGPDKLNGAKGKDICNGGGGRDGGKSCEAFKSIP